MSRYIDADKVLELIEEAFHKTDVNGQEQIGVLTCHRIVREAPTADVVEVRHGEWEYEQLDEYKFYKVTCPYCDAYYMGNYDAYHDPDDFNFCPNCGADMRGKNNGKE